jgi:hypothetical protein
MYFMLTCCVHFDARTLPSLPCELRLKICISRLNRKTSPSPSTVGVAEMASVD